jgi:hypothetical protein
MMRTPRPAPWMVVALFVLGSVSCASQSEKAAYETFLNKIAQDCRPLIIGSENIGQALIFNGVGSDPDKYNNFLSKTAGLYYGSVPPQIYRNSLTAFLGSGTYSDRAFECIFAHLPKK